MNHNYYAEVTDDTLQRLKVMSRRSGETISEILKDLVYRHSNAILSHAVNRNHDHNPNTCTGCEYVEQALARDRKR